MSNAAKAFDNFFRAGRVPGYRQRDDLSRFHPAVRDQLRSLQGSWNIALSNARRDVPGHTDTKPFHVDFVDADEKNATAFCYAGHALIALTVPLVFKLSDICLALSKSQEVAVVLDIQYVADDYSQLQAVLLSMLSAFIVAHEYTHHVYGHVSENDGLNPFLHISSCSGGSLAAQIDEVVADGYSIYHVLENSIVTTAGNGPNPFYSLNADKSSLTPEQTIAAVALAVAAYMFTLRECHLSLLTAYTLSHPPPPVRLELTMTESVLWARKFPTLGELLQRKFRALASVAARVIVGADKASRMWTEQRAFLASQAGQAYTQALINGVNKFKAS